MALLENHWAAPLAERKKNIKTTTNKTKGGKSVIQPEKTERGEKQTKNGLVYFKMEPCPEVKISFIIVPVTTHSLFLIYKYKDFKTYGITSVKN